MEERACYNLNINYTPRFKAGVKFSDPDRAIMCFKFNTGNFAIFLTALSITTRYC